MDDPNLALPVTDLGLSQRTVNALHNAGIQTVRDLASRSEADLLRSGLGHQSLQAVVAALGEMDLALGMSLPPAPPAGDPVEVQWQLGIPLAELGLSARTSRALRNLAMRLVADLVVRTEGELLPRLGRQGLLQVVEALAALDLTLGMRLPTPHVFAPRPAGAEVPRAPAEDDAPALLSTLELTGRTESRLRRLGVQTVADLTALSEAELAAKGIDASALREIVTALRAQGLSLSAETRGR